jgi:hypothetical protein
MTQLRAFDAEAFGQMKRDLLALVKERPSLPGSRSPAADPTTMDLEI